MRTPPVRFLGISLRKPSFGELTAAAVMAVGCWTAAAGIAQASGHGLDASEAGALLIVIAWAAVGARLGLGIDRSLRHVFVNVAVGASLIGVYQAALVIGGAMGAS